MARSLLSVVPLLVTMIFIRQIDKSGCDLLQQLTVNESTQNSMGSADTALQLRRPPDPNLTPRLKKYIFDRYYFKADTPGVREFPVKTKMNMIFSAVNLSSDKSSMSLKAQMKAVWTDMRLYWIPEEFNDTKSVSVDLSDLWHPEFTALNSVDLNNAAVNDRSYVSINSNGYVFWTQPMEFRINSEPDLKYWPSDVYSGVLEVGAVIKNDCTFKLIDTTPSIIVTSPGPEWVIFHLSSDVRLQEPCTKCGSNTFIVKYDITIGREASRFLPIVVYPALAVAMLNLIVFWIPPSGTCKLIISLVDAILVVAILVFVHSKIPLTSCSVPLIARYYICSMVLIVFTVLRALADKYMISASARLAKFIVEFTEFLGLDIMDEDIPEDDWSVSNIKLSGRKLVIEVINRIWFLVFTFVYSLLLFFYVF